MIYCDFPKPYERIRAIYGIGFTFPLTMSLNMAVLGTSGHAVDGNCFGRDLTYPGNGWQVWSLVM